ncbi:hypothetical protein [Roseomonas sp. USHLN139]|uniref:hypothetical protein n=1 Tax=Roseomonas sp. USHLN139 TaxID=3081298 RepID=UPI003B02CD4E
MRLGIWPQGIDGHREPVGRDQVGHRLPLPGVVPHVVPGQEHGAAASLRRSVGEERQALVVGAVQVEGRDIEERQSEVALRFLGGHSEAAGKVRIRATQQDGG